ncbi:hypothetical protein [Salimicrobium flavidum]|uniref:Uncharacterized protein n=1 Tax=Salimicrobium flavidum TaxID=570947 RepID=A0A1N7K7S4_9BACI|nr:hypothetical protein [Salimicrobium flavidum]SIS57608.1 hypothetical protein SAMN05421687_10985 [Salimicrobium flavidum]
MSKKQLLLFGVAIVLFLIASQFILKDQEPTLTHEDTEAPSSPPPEDLPPQWENVENEQAITSFYEEEIPFLQKAREQNLTVEHNQEVDFSEEREGNMTILETWYNKEQIHILYKLDIEAVDLEQPQTPRLIENGFVEDLEGDMRDQELYAYNQAGPVALYDGEIYTYTSVSAISEERNIETPDGLTHTRMDSVERFEQTVLASFHLHLGDGTWKTNDTPLFLSYNPEAYNTQTYTFKEAGYLEKGEVRYKPLRVENDLRGSRLYMHIESSRPLSNRIDATLDTRQEMNPSFLRLSKTDEKHVYMTRGVPLEDASSINFTMNELYVKSEEQVSFEVDTRDFDEHVSTNNQTSTIDLEKSLGTYNGTEITLTKKTYEYPRNLTWELTTNPENSERSHLSPHPYLPLQGENEYAASRPQGVEIEGVPEYATRDTFFSSSEDKLIIHGNQFNLAEHMPVTFTLQNLTDAITFNAESSARR